MILNNITCSCENATRKIDGTGRIIIPKGLRDRLELQEGDEMIFYFLENEEFNCIGIGKNNFINPKYLNAIKVLEELGEEIPISLLKKTKKA